MGKDAFRVLIGKVYGVSCLQSFLWRPLGLSAGARDKDGGVTHLILGLTCHSGCPVGIFCSGRDVLCGPRRYTQRVIRYPGVLVGLIVTGVDVAIFPPDVE